MHVKVKKRFFFGGLKLKLITFVLLAILAAISAQSLYILPLIKDYIEKKAFEVGVTTTERISDFSLFALLERTYENRLSLDDAIKKIQNSNTEGVVGISIYQRQKQDTNASFKYISGFGSDGKDTKIDDVLLEYLASGTKEKIYYDTYILEQGTRSIETYRFMKPIIYYYEEKNILLGFTLLYYDKTPINIIIEESLEIILTSTIVILLLSIIFVYFVGARFTRPILEITEASDVISKGNLDIKLDIRTNDEIEDLACRFNAMVDGLKERQKMKKFVSGSTMNMIQNDSQQALVLGGEYRTLTILFTDIRNSTVISEEQSPSEVINIVNFYLNLQSEIIKEYDGDIDKFVGDQVMASFHGENDVQRALECALEIQKSIEKHNTIRVQGKETICEVGIGINKGEVIVGNMGSLEQMDFTAVGLHVNIAARLCAKAKENEIIIEKSTHEHAIGTHIALYETAFDVKGISYPIQAYVMGRSENEKNGS